MHRQRAALGAGSAAPGGDGDAVLGSHLDDLGNLAGVLRIDHDIRLLGDLAPVHPDARAPVVVDGMAQFLGRRQVHVVAPHDVLQFGQDHRAEK